MPLYRAADPSRLEAIMLYASLASAAFVAAPLYLAGGDGAMALDLISIGAGLAAVALVMAIRK